MDLLSRNANPTEAEIRAWLDGNLCRITGYQNIVRAVQSAAALMQSGQPAAAAVPGPSGVGESIKPKEAPELLRGDAEFVGDLTLPGMAHAAILRSAHGHATI